ncbi:MAG: type IV secretory system conjugative DNA transfer family protein [Clostridia bacterium]|nr:type IV secretory system conjugative DNA transfer family protein [Clostridia bacterium]
MPNAYQLLGSYVFTDPKGELYDKTAGYLKSKGYDIKIFNLVNPKNSDGYNPLMHIQSEIDVDVIANTIVKGQTEVQNQADPYWDDMAEMLLKALIYYLLATRPEEEQNLASCAELVRAANNNGAGNLLTELMNQLPYDHPARMNYKSIEIAPEKTYSSILSSLQSKLGKFDSKDIAELTSTNTIDFEEIGSKKTAVFVISSDTHAAYDFLLTIFFSQMIQRLYDFADIKGGALPQPTYFILDEFANIGKIPDFDKKISTSRSRKISFSVILQNLDQLEAVYEKSHETIIGNCDTTLFLGSNSQKTVEYFSKELGEKTINRDSWSVSKDKHMWRQGYNKQDQVMARALMTPDELRRLDNDLCIIFEKGIKPIKAPKYYYFKYDTIKLVNRFACSHNDIDPIDRGKWRKYNPYNPYVEESEEKKQDTKIESLDDLFDDDISDNKIDESAPELPQDDITNNENDVLSYDVQKELEAKFDELFGALEDDN